MSVSPWEERLDGLPSWAEKLVRSLVGGSGYGTSYERGGFNKGGPIGEVFLADGSQGLFIEAIAEAKEWADALGVPWPPPDPPARERRAVNVVEFAADDEDCAFDQPCAFGHRVEGHAVYCHNDAWPAAPRKCRRTWYTGGETRDEDCPGYVPNPDYTAPAK